MTVSTVNNVNADLRRVQDNQNKPERPLPLQPSGASLPEDLISVSAVPAAPNREAATAASAAQNREAAASVLTDADFDVAPAPQITPQERVQTQSKEALKAQTTRLPANILSLISE